MDATHSPGIREALLDSEVSILSFSTSRKGLSLLRPITGLHLGEAWGLEQATVKPERLNIFHPFYKRSLTGETGYKKPEVKL